MMYKPGCYRVNLPNYTQAVCNNLSLIVFKNVKAMKGSKLNKRLHVGNLEYSATDDDLEGLFSSEGSVVSAKVIRRLDGKSKGFGYVEMETEDEASKAMDKYDQTEFKSRTIYVNEAKPKTNRTDFNRKGRRGFGSGKRDDINSKLRRLRKRF